MANYVNKIKCVGNFFEELGYEKVDMKIITLIIMIVSSVVELQLNISMKRLQDIISLTWPGCKIQDFFDLLDYESVIQRRMPAVDNKHATISDHNVLFSMLQHLTPCPYVPTHRSEFGCGYVMLAPGFSRLLEVLFQHGTNTISEHYISDRMSGYRYTSTMIFVLGRIGIIDTRHYRSSFLMRDDSFVTRKVQLNTLDMRQMIRGFECDEVKQEEKSSEEQEEKENEENADEPTQLVHLVPAFDSGNDSSSDEEQEEEEEEEEESDDEDDHESLPGQPSESPEEQDDDEECEIVAPTRKNVVDLVVSQGNNSIDPEPLSLGPRKHYRVLAIQQPLMFTIELPDGTRKRAFVDTQDLEDMPNRSIDLNKKSRGCSSV
jgi:hypothetical protein